MKATSKSQKSAGKKGGKGAPKLKRSGRATHKYGEQYRRTFRNKLRRVRKCNGVIAANAYVARYAAIAERGGA